MANLLRDVFKNFKVFFICNGTFTTRSRNSKCFQNGGECRHTIDVNCRSSLISKEDILHKFDGNHNIWQCTDEIDPFA